MWPCGNAAHDESFVRILPVARHPRPTALRTRRPTRANGRVRLGQLGALTNLGFGSTVTGRSWRARRMASSLVPPQCDRVRVPDPLCGRTLSVYETVSQEMVSTHVTAAAAVWGFHVLSWPCLQRQGLYLSTLTHRDQDPLQASCLAMQRQMHGHRKTCDGIGILSFAGAPQWPPLVHPSFVF